MDNCIFYAVQIARSFASLLPNRYPLVINWQKYKKHTKNENFSSYFSTVIYSILD